MNVSRRSVLVPALLLPVLAGCGGGDGGGPAPRAVQRPARDAGPAAGTDRWDPRVGGRELMSLKRVGAFMGTSDLVKYGSDGSVIVIKMYGGGGSVIQRCRLRGDEVAKLRHDLARLPLDPAPHVEERPRPTFYTPPPPQYTLTDGKDIETFTQDAMPRDARPLVRRLERTLNGRVATCREVVRTRRA